MPHTGPVGGFSYKINRLASPWIAAFHAREREGGEGGERGGGGTPGITEPFQEGKATN